jgi:hypothetical protein
MHADMANGQRAPMHAPISEQCDYVNN